jgi:hypothetical protein
MYNESVIFSHSRIRRLRRKRPGGTCSHGETCGEKHRDNGQERCAQHCERHKKGRAHSSERSYAITQAFIGVIVRARSVV